jgi:archaellum biogenesis ATPase FlaH
MSLKAAVKEYFTPSNVRVYFESELKGIKWNGNGQGITLCPFHDDKKESLSLSESGAFFCHACGAKGDLISFHQKRHSFSFNDALNELAKRAGISASTSKPERIHIYFDETGTPLYRKLIFKSGDKKSASFEHYSGGQYLKGLQGVSRTLYNLHKLKGDSNRVVFLSESEKDADGLTELGLIATSSGGAESWRPEFSELLKGRQVCILPHNDQAGVKYAETVAKSLWGKAASIRVVDPSIFGTAKGADVSDLLQAWKSEGKTAEQIKAALREIVKSTPEWTPTKMSENCLPKDKNVGTPQEAEQGKAEKTLLSSLLKWNDIHNLNIETEWLLDKLIPEGAITLLFGRGGIGKTSLALQIVYAIAQGQEFAGLKTKQVFVTFIDFENPLSVLKERITCLGKTESVLLWHGICEPSPAKLDKGEEWKRFLDLPKGLLVFDTLRASFLGDENDSQDVAIVISRLKELRDKGYSILLLHHTPKSSDSIYKGSTAILDLVDHALCLEPIKEDDELLDFDPDRLFKFGTKQKTRFEPSHIFLKFNPEIKGFTPVADPDHEKMLDICSLLREIQPAKQRELKKRIKEDLGLGEYEIRRLLKKGEGVAWDVQRGGSGKENRALIYTPKFDRMIGQPIYSHPIIPSNPERDKSLSNQALLNSQQIIDNACLVDKIDSVQPINTTNHSINTSNRCSDCLLTPQMMKLCEVQETCPKGVIE